MFKKVIGENIPVQTIFIEIYEEGKIMLEPKIVTEQEIGSYEIDQF